MDDPRLIIVGDPNFTILAYEIWGSRDQLDPLMDFFSKMIHDADLIDVNSGPTQPSWSNGRVRDSSILK